MKGTSRNFYGNGVIRTFGSQQAGMLLSAVMAAQNLTPTRKVNERRFKLNQCLVAVHRLVSPETGETKGVDLTLYWPKKSCKAYFTTDNGRSFKQVVILPSSRLPDSVDMTIGNTESDPDTLTVLKDAFARWQSDVNRELAD